MQKWNFKHLSVYTTAVLIITLYSLVISVIPVNQELIQAYQKILFAVPVLFIISAFLAFKIAETGIVLIALSFLLLSITAPLSNVLAVFNTQTDNMRISTFLLSTGNWNRFFEVFPRILPLSLSLIFLVPEKIGRFSTTVFKIFIAFIPLVLFFTPEYSNLFLIKDHQAGGSLVLWPGMAAVFFPLAGPYLHRNRRSSTFSAALTTALILVILPIILTLEGYLKDSSYLFAGIILLHSLYRVYWENSYVDELTGLFNRRALDERLRKLRSGYALSMADVDHFKNFNDTYGHDEGDNVLRLVSKILYLHFGKSAYRYGGEEFCIVFLKTNAKSAADKMDEARAAIEEQMFSIRKNVKNRKKASRKKSVSRAKKVRLTISAGIAVHVKGIHDALAVLKNADKALYKAKEGGRNRVEIIVK